MSSIRVLAVSSSRVGNSAYLETVSPLVQNFLGSETFNIAFVPFATADNDYEGYAQKVREGLASLPHIIQVVTPGNAKQVIEQAGAVMVGGGNTFKLLHDIYDLDIFNLVREKVQAGAPYIGWSAGANISGLTIKTTNDMPIIEPKSFNAFGFLPFQINPHYLNVKPQGHNGETRDDRLNEFLQLNKTSSIVGLPEGTALRLQDNKLELLGNQAAVLFNYDDEAKAAIKKEISIGSDLSHLLQTT